MKEEEKKLSFNATPPDRVGSVTLFSNVNQVRRRE